MKLSIVDTLLNFALYTNGFCTMASPAARLCRLLWIAEFVWHVRANVLILDFLFNTGGHAPAYMKM